MDNLLGKNVLVLYENDKISWVELKRVRHEKTETFKVCNEDYIYSKKSIVDIPSV